MQKEVQKWLLLYHFILQQRALGKSEENAHVFSCVAHSFFDRFLQSERDLRELHLSANTYKRYYNKIFPETAEG